MKIKNFTHRLLLAAGGLLGTITSIVAQTPSIPSIEGGQVTTSLNELLKEYAVPIITAILVLSVATGLITNMDKIIDKNGDGSRKEGIVNVIWYLAYAILFILVVAAVITLMQNFSLEISNG